jgi:UDP-N-acetylmuramate--alanine ligase
VTTKIHFIGIGGIGVSALAKYYLAKGYQVSGCDLVSSEITKQLKIMGAKVRIGQPKADCISAGTKKIIYSPAVPATNPEIRNPKSEIRNKSQILNTKYQILSYPEALGELTKEYFTIAVSGTHGKSTTTAMLGLLLVKAGLDPTVIVGTKLKEFGNSNFRFGRKEYKILNTKYKILVIEADEHFASFLNYWPKIIVLTTIEADHLDYWKTLKNLVRGFKKYITHISQDGTLVANKDDKNIQRILNPKSEARNPKQIQNTKYKIQKYSLKQPEAKKLRKILKIPGEHNVSNALAALAVARILGIKDATSFKALGGFRGTWRRFEIFTLRQAQGRPYTLVSDYGHHPTEIRVTVKAAREKWPKKKIWLVFQPHQYQRTYYLWKDFVKVLSTLPLEKLILTDIYDVAGREGGSMRKKVSSEKLVRAIENWKLKIENYPVLYIPTPQQVEQYLQKNLQGEEVIMVMGAGDIYDLTLRLRAKNEA